MRSALFAVGVAAGVSVFPRVALARSCSELPNPVVIESGDTQEPLLKALGQKLANSTAQRVSVLYRTTGTCTLIDDVYKGNKIPALSNLSYLPTAAEDPAWDPSKPSPTCTVDAAGGLDIDIGIAATFVASCTTASPPPGKAAINGPNQAYGFITHKDSSEVAITANEAYFAFGFGSLGAAKPWTDEAFLFVRTPTKSTQLTLGAAIGVPAAKFKGQPFDKSSEVLTAVINATDTQKPLGLMGVEVFDQNRGKVKLLAFKGREQRYGYFPDSTATSFDKKNVRDGHYLPWAPTVYLTKVDGTNQPSIPNAKLFIDLVLGDRSLSDVDGLAAVVSKGLIPQCAMTVSRQFDGGDLALYSAPAPCGCFFDASVPQGTTKCATCTGEGTTSTCGVGKCRHGYCEAR